MELFNPLALKGEVIIINKLIFLTVCDLPPEMSKLEAKNFKEMRKIIVIAAVVLFAACKNKPETNKELASNDTEAVAMQEQSIHKFTVEDINGEEFDLSSLKGKKVLVVNTASKCGLTPQYEQLQELYENYGGDDFTIVGFPANNFGNQEPGSNEEIAGFCKLNYGVSFPMMSKISVKGEDMHPVYGFLTQKSENGFSDSEVQWNFQKYLIDESGRLVGVVEPQTLPTDERITSWIMSN